MCVHVFLRAYLHACVCARAHVWMCVVHACLCVCACVRESVCPPDRLKCNYFVMLTMTHININRYSDKIEGSHSASELRFMSPKGFEVEKYLGTGLDVRYVLANLAIYF